EKEAWRELGPADGLPEGFFFNLSQTPDGAVWCAARGGGVVRLLGDSVLRLPEEIAKRTEAIRCLFCDVVGRIWFGSRSGGLGCLTPRQVRAFGLEAGFESDYVRGL